mgnify:FL=1
MKTAILYVSAHHGNTKKLLDAIRARYDVVLIDATGAVPSLEGYDVIGIASGVAYGKFYKEILAQTEARLPRRKKVFFLFTAGKPSDSHANAVRVIAQAKDCACLGAFGCKGYDTYGPFKLIGGLNRGAPKEKDIQAAVEFYSRMMAEAEKN